MIIIKEYKSGNEVYFKKEITSENIPTIINTIYYQSVIKEINKVTYLMLYDTRMRPLSDSFIFLNPDESAQSVNSRIKALEALKFLFVFKDIINKELKDFTKSDVTNLKLFLKGLSPKGKALRFELLSTRNNQTVNGYLSVYRQYLLYLDQYNKHLMEKSSKKTHITDPGFETDFTVEKYKSNEKVPHEVVEVPWYISVEEFALIIDEIRKNYGKLEEIIIRLMFQCGLRIGECLGLTADDLVIEQVKKDFIPIAYIRNRLTDRKDQLAKTCMKVTDAKVYRSKEYRTEGYGYQFVVVPQDLYDLTNEYIEQAHVQAREKHKDNYCKYTIADRVRKADKYEDDNYYIFINSIGKPLLSHSWNNKLREIFNKVGITVDKECREHNLNHRFRHGYAMFNVQYLGCREVDLAKRMRHSSILSVAAYFKPTISDSIKVKTEFANSLYEVIPSLVRKE